MIQLVDRFLDGITMYKVVLYGLLIEAGIAIVLGFLGFLPFQGMPLLLTVALLVSFCWGSNFIFAKLFKIPPNSESAIITGLILFLIFSPIETVSDSTIYIVAALLAMATKYILAWRRKHLFNPAAFAAVVLGLLGSPIVWWWVGSLVLLPVVAIIGCLILRKVRRFMMFTVFVITAVSATTIWGITSGYKITDVWSQIITSWPIVFFGTVMFTEPLTTPPTHRLRLIYGALVGVLFGIQFHIGPFFSTPELALVLGNLFSYAVSSKQKLLLMLQEKKKIAGDMYEFIFVPKGDFMFKAGQYMEWTLGHTKVDMRGNRRYFTVSSSPTEPTLNLGVKFAPQGSTFKNTLLSMKENDTILAGQLAGDFTLPANTSKKLAFLAGGIGVTPFRSMIKYMLDKNEKRDVVLFYSNKDAGEIVYKDIFDNAEKKLGIATVYTLTDKEHLPLGWKQEVGRVDEAMIKKYVKDYKSRIYYISGPHPMIVGYKALLKSLGIPSSHVIVDYFPGFV